MRVESPTPFLGPDIDLAEEKRESSAEDDDDNNVKELSSANTAILTSTTLLSSGPSAADGSSLITFDLETLLMTNAEAAGAKNGEPKILTIGEDGQLGIRLASSMASDYGSTRMANGAAMVDLTPSVNDDPGLLANGVDDPNAIYIQNLLNGNATTTTMGMTNHSSLTSIAPVISRTSSTVAKEEICLESDDEPEIVFVEEKTTAPRPKSRLSTNRLFVNQLGPSLKKKISMHAGWRCGLRSGLWRLGKARDPFLAFIH